MLELVIAVLLAVCLVILLLVSYRLYRYALCRDADYSLAGRLERAQTPEQRAFVEEGLKAIENFRAREPQEWDLRSGGLRLHAYFQRPEGQARGTVVIVHGWKDGAEFRFLDAEQYLQAGYAVLVPDLRGHGKSEGRHIDMSLRYANDLNAWCARLDEEGAPQPYVLDGLSMGAATVLSRSAPENLPTGVVAILADCGYTSLTEQSLHMLKALWRPLAYLVLVASSFWALLLSGVRLWSQPSPLSQLERAEVPVLIIHGEADRYVPFWMGERYAQALHMPIHEFWSVPGARHAESIHVAGTAYMAHKLAFLDRVDQAKRGEA